MPGGTANPPADNSANVAALPPSTARSAALASARFTIIEVAYIINLIGSDTKYCDVTFHT